jgi:hypothetical protein
MLPSVIVSSTDVHFVSSTLVSGYSQTWQQPPILVIRRVFLLPNVAATPRRAIFACASQKMFTEATS